MEGLEKDLKLKTRQASHVATSTLKRRQQAEREMKARWVTERQRRDVLFPSARKAKVVLINGDSAVEGGDTHQGTDDDHEGDDSGMKDRVESEPEEARLLGMRPDMDRGRGEIIPETDFDTDGGGLLKAVRDEEDDYRME